MKGSDIRVGQLRMICDSEYSDEVYLVLRRKGRSATLISYEWEIFHQGEVKVWFEYEMSNDIIVTGPGAN